MQGFRCIHVCRCANVNLRIASSKPNDIFELQPDAEHSYAIDPDLELEIVRYLTQIGGSKAISWREWRATGDTE
ncbi:unnamed protein product [Gongylonema pulchrum]|uniref:Integron gene cassette protein n=1 Tax=Gongylonema pulchrum TaxID=637853 RepID=A0A183D9F8_9BILA|nr:unnamed protein product [Gongylonema pulchrum]